MYQSVSYRTLPAKTLPVRRVRIDRPNFFLAYGMVSLSGFLMGALFGWAMWG